MFPNRGSRGRGSVEEDRHLTGFLRQRSRNRRRDRARIDRNDTFNTADILDEMAKLATRLADTIAPEIQTIRDTKEEVESSRWELYVNHDGTVDSRRSNWEIATEFFPFGPAAVTAKESAEMSYEITIQGALTKILEADLEGGAKFATLLEKLSDSVKTALVAKPSDPELARILEDYQTDSSVGDLQLWPTGLELEALQRIKPGLQPQMLSTEEIAVMSMLLAKKDYAGIVDQFEMTQQAQEAAIQVYPQSVDDGHGDAFRHAYWNALMAQRFGPEWTEMYGISHEKSGGNPPNREAMDLFNNQLGREIGAANPDASPEELQQLIKNEIDKGNALVLAPPTGDLEGTPVITWSNQVAETGTKQTSGVDIPLPRKD
ncbi:DUF6973 domain-containing protein [Nocardia sp. CA-290969]|uniref:DUF6973 domain-containing protein n=1 Tax=Nocardia sp. CA-290969 TaxID=3239986 RepID=UPI003D8D2229